MPEKHIRYPAYQYSPYIGRYDEILHSEPRHKIYQCLAADKAAKEYQEGNGRDKDRRIPLDSWPHVMGQQQRYQKIGNGR